MQVNEEKGRLAGRPNLNIKRFDAGGNSTAPDVPRQIVAVDVISPEPGRITTHIIVDHDGCGRRHVHLVRRAGQVTSVIRRPPCGGTRYRIVFAGTTFPLPRTSPEVA